MVSLKLLLCTVFLSAVAATNVSQCPGHSFKNLAEDVTLDPCRSPPCKLKKGSNQHVSIKFTPEEDLKDLKNHVTARIFGADVPFVGVDGVSVCDSLYTEDDQKVSCPLKAGTNYIYKGSFKVEAWYPEINVDVHWSLRHKNVDVKCFEMPVRIK